MANSRSGTRTHWTNVVADVRSADVPSARSRVPAARYEHTDRRHDDDDASKDGNANGGRAASERRDPHHNRDDNQQGEEPDQP
ncbi:MAG: hypothetical protein ACRDLS_01905 [Solirubrobacteraceae bacterium]